MTREAHTYLQTHRISGARLTFALRTECSALEETAAYRRSGRTAKTLVNEGQLRIELVALREGTAMAPHRAAAHVTIHVVRGALRVEMADGPTDLGPGGLLVLAPDLRHRVIARKDACFLLTLAVPG